jgi:hypothetical protein
MADQDFTDFMHQLRHPQLERQRGEGFRDFVAFMQQLRRPLLGPDGAQLLDYLEVHFCERRDVLLEKTAAGAIQVVRRMSSFAADPYTTAWREGQRSVVLFLKDLRDMEG